MKNNMSLNNMSLNNESLDSLASLGLALSNKTRLEILKAIFDGYKTVTKISKRLNIPTSNVIFHLEILEKGGLIYLSHLSQTMIAAPVYNNVNITLEDSHILKFSEEKEIEFSIPVGAYISVEHLLNHIRGRDEKGNLPLNESNIYDPSRFNAQVIFLRKGILNYPLRKLDSGAKLKNICISFEACAETSAYDNNYKSDISVLINGIKLLTYTCPGDFGGRKGNLNPVDYPSYFTQFGEMVSIYVNEIGVYKNGKLINSKININDIKLDNNEQNVLSIGNLPDSNYQGGLNIFGEKLGDYPQSIKVKYTIVKEVNNN